MQIVLPDSTALPVRALIDSGLRGFAGGDYAAAARDFRRALAVEPENDDTRLKLGAALSAAGEGDGAIALYRAILAHDPGHLGALTNLGTALVRLGRHAEAIESLDRAVRLHPDSGLAAFNLGCALDSVGRLEESVRAYRIALGQPEINVRTAANLGGVLSRLGRHDEALALYDAALEVAPDDAHLRWNRARTLLLLGHDELGWRDYAWRWRTADHAHALRHGDIPLWNGEALQGRRILLHAEQGFGDTIQFVRYATAVAARGGRVILEVQPPLKRLLTGFPGAECVYGVGETLPPADLQCPLLGLPARIGEMPNVTPYLSAPVSHIGDLPSGLRVGLVWAGSPTNGADRRRSLDITALEPLSRVDGVAFVSLQAGSAGATRTAFGVSMYDPMPNVRDFADTAAIVAALDLVIAVDTAVAHLAGALGKPVWLLNRFDTCWRWRLGREDTPWYPTMRIFRQKSPDDWKTPINRIAAGLAVQARSHAGGRIF